METRKIAYATGVLLTLIPIMAFWLLGNQKADLNDAQLQVGKVDNLMANYREWVGTLPGKGKLDQQTVALGWYKGLSSAHSDAHGKVTI